MKYSDKIKLLERVRTIEGLTDDERSALLSLINEKKTYGLVWEDKPEAVEERLRKELPVLIEDKDKAIIGGGKQSDNQLVNNPNHVIIEGDNLEALSILSYTHAGKIDVIYIDPPYNTGNKDFKYNDTFIDPDNEYRHSTWLSFMSKRLRIAKKLLSDRGVIFISIDDNEQANLKLLCDEIFGIDKFISSLPRLTKKAGKTTNAIAVNHDYVLVYSKLNTFKLLEHNDPAFKYTDEYCLTRGKYKLSQTLDYDTLGYVNSLDYPIAIDGKTFYPGNVTEEQYLERKKTNPKDGFRWRWSEELFKFGYDNGFIVVKHSKNGSRIYTKTYKNAAIGKKDNCYFIEIKERGNVFSSIQLVENEFSNDNARKELDSLFDEKAFSYPKPISLPKICSWLTSNEQSTILDFFAGSGTTLHAVMQLNAEDGGKRTCILCTNNESGICENVTYERNKRVINGYTKPNGEAVEGLHNNNLRYYRTDFVSREQTQKNRRELMNKSTDMLCIKEDLYDELPKFGHIRLNPKGARYFANDKKQMLIIYVPEFIPYFVDEIDKMELAEPIKVYVYAPDRYAYNDDFAIVEDKVSLCALPQSIIDAMSRVMPKKLSEKEIASAAPRFDEIFSDENSLFGSIK